MESCTHLILPECVRIGYNGVLHDSATGAQLLGRGHRLHLPSLMRFCSPDHLSPLGAGGLNAYAYCNGDPVNRNDPDGMFALWVGAGIAALGSLGVFGGAAIAADRAGHRGASAILVALGVVAAAGFAAVGLAARGFGAATRASPRPRPFLLRTRGSHAVPHRASGVFAQVAAPAALRLPRINMANGVQSNSGAGPLLPHRFRPTAPPAPRGQARADGTALSASRRVRFADEPQVRFFQRERASSSSSSSSSLSSEASDIRSIDLATYAGRHRHS